MNKKLVVVGIIVLLMTIGLSGCTSEGANVKITSVDIDDHEQTKQWSDNEWTGGPIDFPYITYNVTIGLKNIGDVGTDAWINLKSEYWNDYTETWGSAYTFNRDTTTFYIDARGTTTITMSVSAWITLHGTYRLKIDINVGEGNNWHGTDSYEKVFYLKL